MEHLRLLLVCSALLTACDDQLSNPVLPPPPPAGFVVFGIVETEDGFPMIDATAELIRAHYPVQTTTTNNSGHFTFSGVFGSATVRVSKPGYTGEQRVLTVTETVLTRFRLMRLLPDQVLTLGDTITATVQEGAPPCDPVGWDAEAPCRRFHFIAPSSGKLLVAITWQGSPEIDAVLVVGRAGYVASSVPAGFERVMLEGQVVKGVDYELRVNSYYGRQDFKLTAELIQ